MRAPADLLTVATIEPTWTASTFVEAHALLEGLDTLDGLVPRRLALDPRLRSGAAPGLAVGVRRVSLLVALVVSLLVTAFVVVPLALLARPGDTGPDPAATARPALSVGSAPG